MQEQNISVSRRHEVLIQLFYRFILMNYSTSTIKQQILDDKQSILDPETLKFANDIADKQDELIDLIIPFLSEKWKWKRLPIIVQSILIIGVYEIKYTDLPKALIINELVNYTKIYVTYFDFKFINACLDKF